MCTMTEINLEIQEINNGFWYLFITKEQRLYVTIRRTNIFKFVLQFYYKSSVIPFCLAWAIETISLS